MNIPNSISMFRIFLIPLFIYFFVTGEGHNQVIYPVIIFIISGLSDVLDGYIARRFHMETKLGAVLDPLADKLMLLTALTCFAFFDYIPYWIVIIVAIKEIVLVGGGVLAYNKGIVNRANVFGKMATVLFHISIVMFLFSDTLAFVLLILSVAVSLIAFVNYYRICMAKKRQMEQSDRQTMR